MRNEGVTGGTRPGSSRRFVLGALAGACSVTVEFTEADSSDVIVASRCRLAHRSLGLNRHSARNRLAMSCESPYLQISCKKPSQSSLIIGKGIAAWVLRITNGSFGSGSASIRACWSRSYAHSLNLPPIKMTCFKKSSCRSGSRCPISGMIPSRPPGCIAWRSYGDGMETEREAARPARPAFQFGLGRADDVRGHGKR